MPTDLEAENAGLLQFLYSCPAGLIEFTSTGAIGMVNPAAMGLLLPIAGRTFVTNLFDVMDGCAPELRNMVCNFGAAHGAICDGHRIVTGPGERPTVLACSIVRLTHDRHVATLSDVTEQVARERRLKQAETWFASLLDGVDNVAVLSLDADGRIDAVTPSAVRQTGFAERDLLGHPFESFDRPDRATATPPYGEAIAAARRDGWHLHEGWHARADGGRYWCQRLVAARAHVGDAVSGYTLVLRAVKRQGRDTADLRRMLTRDHLTGASNRAHFFEVAERELTRSRGNGGSLALIVLDIDHFKRVNDGHGHAAGDAVLREAARRCEAELRPEDVFARIGGEEFVAFVPGATLTEAAAVAERLRLSLAREPVDAGGTRLRITGSFGCSALDGHPDATVAGLLAAADGALYRAKRDGRDRVALSDAGRAAA
ncbi:sensor domain-containing diguanylate cyclase [Methylobacterium pseudosasicola]|uniref:diguanylate cyclase n=1 Tax=Methylobacterium pseudosasicola TaxID=582667 RepID=A0A1I4V3V9_9HYPH|nr:sensor domain-containing diguanylate cyclase [Methylobacterium pseudosasicola]SFM95845.1 PAS domain S-box-containing protein/diguanylate cyclase (GGDEF) domain-containing protein [Methylobacterium pseudosasicola]